MNGQVYLEIRSLDSLISFLTDVKQRTGMLKDVSPEMVRSQLSGLEFPLHIPVNLDGILGLCENKALRATFGKRVEKTTIRYLEAIIGAGK